MSVGSCTILAMNEWKKYTHVCHTCDALIEYTSIRDVIDITCECGGKAGYLSVEPATILSTTNEKEDKMETTTIAETYNPNLLVTYKKIDGDEVSYPTEKVVDIEYALDQSRRNYKNLSDKQNEWYRKESQLRTLLEEVYADSQDQETLEQIANIFDVPLTKEIEATAWIRVDMTIEVDMREGDYDIEDLVRNNLTVDSYGSEISVNDFDVDRVEEGAY